MSEERYKPSLSENVAVNALVGIEDRAYELFWEEKREHGNYEDAALEGIRYAIRATADLMEQERRDSEGVLEPKLADLYWSHVHS